MRGLSIQLTQVGKRAMRGVSAVMQEEGMKIRDKAREYAPVDKGNLEDAIRCDIDRNGLNGRTLVYVYVDMDYPAGANGKTVGDYAMIMHEGLTPYGELNLGKYSQIKAATFAVGGKFLERAIDEVAPKIESRVAAIARKIK